MIEPKAQKRKLKILKLILRWIGLGLLSVLIILGLFFQAPWKVIALLLIILAACTQLPRPARKWFWLSTAAVVIALIIWVFLPDDNEGWRPYTFDEEFAALEAKRPAIPDSENAATIYNQLLDNYDANTFEPNFMDDDLDVLTSREPWLSKDYPELAEWLKDQQDTISKLLKASKKEKCRFPIITDVQQMPVRMNRLSAMRRWAFLLTRTANNDLGDGRIDQAIEKNLTILQMAKHQYQHPMTIDLLVAMAIEAFATKQFNRFVVSGNAREEHLSVIEKALVDIKHDWSSDWRRILDCEKLFAKNMLCGIYYEINPEGKTRLSRNRTRTIRTQLLKESPPRAYWGQKLGRVGTILFWFFTPSTATKAGEIIDASYEKYYTMAEQDFDWKKEAEEPSPRLGINFRCLIEHLVGSSAASYYRIHDIYLRASAEKRGARLIITLRRYKNKTGRWPESLEDIKSTVPAETFVDPFNEGSFVYKLTDDSFKLYSKGKNNIDEDGKYRRGHDDWPIWPGPGRTRKTQEENADAKQK